MARHLIEDGSPGKDLRGCVNAKLTQADHCAMVEEMSLSYLLLVSLKGSPDLSGTQTADGRLATRFEKRH